MPWIKPFILLLALLLPRLVHATNPAWWTDDVGGIDGNGTRILESGGTADNYAAANVGQLKFVAWQAKRHLDHRLEAIGGSGPYVDEIVNAFTPNSSQTTGEQASARDANYVVANLGQLKNIAKKFYDRLRAIGYDTKQNLIDQGLTGWTRDYPWDPLTSVEANYVPANLGQLKLVFSFSVTGFDMSAVDADDDGLLDVWEVRAGFDPFVADDPDDDPDDDDADNGAEVAANTSPTDPAPLLTLSSPASAALVP